MTGIVIFWSVWFLWILLFRLFCWSDILFYCFLYLKLTFINGVVIGWIDIALLDGLFYSGLSGIIYLFFDLFRLVRHVGSIEKLYVLSRRLVCYHRWGNTILLADSFIFRFLISLLFFWRTLIHYTLVLLKSFEARCNILHGLFAFTFLITFFIVILLDIIRPISTTHWLIQSKWVLNLVGLLLNDGALAH